MSKRSRKNDRDFARLRIAAHMSYKRAGGNNQYSGALRDDVKRELGLFSWNDPDRKSRGG